MTHIITYPTPHFEKLNAVFEKNIKLPDTDKPRILEAIERYKTWIKDMDNVVGDNTGQMVERMVALLNEYKFYIDVHLIFDSQDDFLYRQKGQLRLDNSIIEEFLPRLIRPSIIPELSGLPIDVGPVSSYSSAYFISSLNSPQLGGGINIRTKDQNFSISKKLFLRASHDSTFKQSVDVITNLAYVAAECKTNLDKTMFQEAIATAHDVKTAVSGAKYFLLCEWLDMTPLSTTSTDIDEVIILRKAKRINSNIRKNFNNYSGRQASREQFVTYLQQNSFQPEMFMRFVNHIRKLLQNEVPVGQDILSQGYF